MQSFTVSFVQNGQKFTTGFDSLLLAERAKNRCIAHGATNVQVNYPALATSTIQ